ncbi:GNAT family N-acetyltransferase [Actinomadura rudentiformis]|uniref:GNAT family N-acetyltransferase n=1 Tax=Actinomadura rudentiformis TaxID=359158 RepID=UPI00178C6A6D|nr:GNAT family N-acetyltransferase [Actinomadura rudentiformis]
MNVNAGVRWFRIRQRGPRFQIRLAEIEHVPVVIDLIEQAADWLREEKDTEQWNKPWPDREGRDKRVYEGVVNRLTWILWDGARPVASVTINPFGNDLWTEDEQRTEAVYIHRLVIDRAYAGTGLGAELIRWAGRQGRRRTPGARLIRIDVWTDNKELHAYYRRQGFRDVAIRTVGDDCPSGALFQRQIRRTPWSGTPRIGLAPSPRGERGARWLGGRGPAQTALGSVGVTVGTLATMMIFFVLKMQ